MVISISPYTRSDVHWSLGDAIIILQTQFSWVFIGKLLSCKHTEAIDNDTALNKVMVWFCQATGFYLTKLWRCSMPPYRISRPHWVKCQEQAIYRLRAIIRSLYVLIFNFFTSFRYRELLTRFYRLLTHFNCAHVWPRVLVGYAHICACAKYDL